MAKTNSKRYEFSAATKNHANQHPTMKTQPKGWCTATLATLTVTALCLTARADFVGNTYTTGTPSPTTWDQVNGQNPFWTSCTNVNPSSAVAASQNPPPGNGVVSGALYYPLGETIFAPQQHYNLKAISILVSGSPAGNLQMHLFDVTSMLASNNGGITNGSGANYNICGSLLGSGNGLTFTNFGASTGTNQEIFKLSNGTNDDTGIVIGDGHVYALEIWAQTAAPTVLNWWRTGANTADCGQTGEGFMGGGEYATRQTVTTSGNAGGAPRNYALALFGTTTGNPITVSTNAAPGLLNHFVDTFPASAYSAGQITNVWTNWFGAAVTYPSDLTWSTYDISGHADSGSLKISADFSQGSQYTVMNGFGGTNSNNGMYPAFNGLNLIRFEADVMFAPGSSTTVNGTVTNYGHLQFGTVSNFTSPDYFGSIEVPVGSTNWNHVIAPISAVTDTNLISIYDVLIHLDGNWYSGTALNGASTLYVDNVKFTGPQTQAAPPSIISLKSAVPGCRFFTPDNGSASARQNMATVYSDLSWYNNDASQFPFAYTITITNFPATNYAFFEYHMFLIPLNYLMAKYNGDPTVNNFVDWDTTNIVALRIQPTGSNYVATFSYKTNLSGGNPNVTSATLLSSVAVGTWSLAFNNNTNATLTAPGGILSTNFSIPAADAATFANPVTAFFGVEANAAGSQGQAADIAHITITDFVDDNFSQDYILDATTWTVNASTATVPASIWVTGPSVKYWIDWSTPDFGFGLIESTNIANTNAWVAPAVYNSHTPPVQNLIGDQRWALLVPNQVPAAAAKNLFFALKAPPAPN